MDFKIKKSYHTKGSRPHVSHTTWTFVKEGEKIEEDE